MEKKIVTQKEFEQIILDLNKTDPAKKPSLINLGGNLYIYPRKSDSKIKFAVRVLTGKSDTKIVIGYYPNTSLSEARLKAKDLIKEAKKSFVKDVVEDIDLTPSFAEFFNLWRAKKVQSYKKGSSRVKNLQTIWNTTISKTGLGELKLSEITVKDVCTRFLLLRQTDWNKHYGISIVNMCLQAASLQGLIPFNPIAGLLSGSESPFKCPKKGTGFKTIPPEDIFEKFVIPLKDTTLIQRSFYLVLLLTGFRFGEVRNLHVSWCDFGKNVILIPADAVGANKTQTEYIKPMTVQIKKVILNIINRQKDKSDLLFQSPYGNRPLCEGTFREPIKALTTRELDPHGIRKVMRTWMSSQGVPVNIAELALQHDVRSALEKVYDRYKYTEEVRTALQQWNDYVEKGLPPEFLEIIYGKEDKA